MSKPITAVCVYGTRPEAIKMIPVANRLTSDHRFRTMNIVTGQHREMLYQVLNLFGMVPDYDLSIMSEQQSLADIVACTIRPLCDLFVQIRPDIVLVQGDTSTAFVAALAAFYNHIPVGHIEAGLRTGDKFQPFPEEINRRLISQVADFHFAPTQIALDNLLSEGVSEDRVLVTGNTVIDAFQLALKHDSDTDLKIPPKFNGFRVILVTAHRRENHGEPMRSICRALREILVNHPDTAIVFPVHYSPKVRETVFPMLSGEERIWLTDPLNYIDNARMIKNSTLILTDSGGIQEEAPSVGKPVLVLREKTERPEGIAAGTAKLVGTNRDRIVKEVGELLSRPEYYNAMAKSINPYGDGKAAERIVDFILYAFSKTHDRPERFSA